MTKAKLKQDCEAGKKGEIVDLEGTELDIYTSEGLATTDYEKLPETTPEKTEKKTEPTDEGKGPLWSERIVIQRNTQKQDGRNIKINLWPPSEDHPEYGHNLELVESRNVDGEWEDKKIRLTKGAKTLFLAEMIKRGWQKLRELT